MAEEFVQPYVASMKATPSTAGEVQNEQAPATRLPVGAWDEETFALTIHQAGAAVPVPSVVWPDWEDIEAVGAADDPTRFKIEFQVTEQVSSCP